MTRRDHMLLAALAVAGTLLTLFQCWYISLPLEDASRIDICRLTPVVNCFESLHAHGIELFAFGLPVFPALAALFFFQTSLCLFACVVIAPRRDAWLGLARLVSFPVSGLAIFVLLNDAMVAKATSASGVLVALISLAISVTTVLHGVGTAPLRRSGPLSVGLALCALVLGFFLHGAGSARRAYDEILREQQAALPAITYARFAHDIPRAGAAALGNTLAQAEVILIVDPAREDSRRLMADAAARMPEFASRVLLTVYAPGAEGARLILAHRSGKLADYLRDPTTPVEGDLAAMRGLVEQQQGAWTALGHQPPTALIRGRKWTGRFELREALEAATEGVRTKPE